MWELLERLFGQGFLPHGHCYLWSPSMVWTQVVSNLLIGGAYCAITVTLSVLARRIHHTPFVWAYVAFGTFILACGITHFSDVVTIWHPIYWADAGARVVTAAASVVTAFLIVPLVPQAVSLADAARLAQQRGQQLEQTHRQLEQAHARLAERENAAVRRAEATERQLRELIDNLPELAWTALPDGHIDFYNRRWFEYTGTTLEQMQGWGWKRVHDPEILPTVVENWQGSLATGEPFEMEFPLRAADGQFRWFLTRVRPLRDAEGRIARWFGSNTDIHERRQAQETLRETQWHLEQSVRERTRELSASNESLRHESAERRRSEERFRAAIAGMLDAFYIIEPVGDAQGHVVDYRFLEVNETGAQRLRRPRAEVVGKRQSEVTDPATHTILLETQNRVMHGGQPEESEIRVERAGEPPRWVRQQLVPFASVLAITARDITLEKAADAAIARSLAEKELLLKEIHHRVKNNLQVISSLLKLQGEKIPDGPMKDVFRDSQSRVRSIALLHEKLYQSTNFASIDMGGYVREVTDRLLRSYGSDASRVAIVIEAADVSLGLDAAMPCGLIVNELVTNALKYAFPAPSRGAVTIRMAQADGHTELIVSDDGRGLPPELNPEHVDTLGLHLVQMLSRQLDGVVAFETGRVGARCTIRFPSTLARR